MKTVRVDKKNPLHEHDWVPIAFDYDCAFGFYECAECFQYGWRNLHHIDPVEEIGEKGDSA